MDEKEGLRSVYSKVCSVGSDSFFRLPLFSERPGRRPAKFESFIPISSASCIDITVGKHI